MKITRLRPRRVTVFDWWTGEVYFGRDWPVPPREGDVIVDGEWHYRVNCVVWIAGPTPRWEVPVTRLDTPVTRPKPETPKAEGWT